MSDEEWIPCRELYRVICSATDDESARARLRQYASEGELLFRARRGRFLWAGDFAHCRNWEIPAHVWHREGAFDPEESTLSAPAVPTDLGTIIELESVLPPPTDILVRLDGLEALLTDVERCGLLPAGVNFGGKSAPVSHSTTSLRRGPEPDVERHAAFAAGLAYIANTEGLDTFRSRAAVYDAVSSFLATKGKEAMDEKNFRTMIDLARRWVEQA